MNERIQELLEQAASHAGAFPSGQNNSWETQVNFMDKFAELIVRECAGRVDNILRERKDGGGTMGDEIREHFGVEE